MQQTGTNNLDLAELVDGWSEVVIKILRIKIARMNIKQTGSLYDSLNFSVSGQGFTFQIYFTYNLYGKFVDMGVGRNYSKGNSGDVEAVRKQRKRKEWQSRIFYAQVMTLGELARKQYGEAAVNKIVSTIHAIKDMKSSEYKSRKAA